MVSENEYVENRAKSYEDTARAFQGKIWRLKAQIKDLEDELEVADAELAHATAVAQEMRQILSRFEEENDGPVQ